MPLPSPPWNLPVASTPDREPQLSSSITTLLPTDSQAVIEALAHAYACLDPAVFNHSLRVYLLASMLARLERTEVKEDLLFLAAIFHDFGTCELYNGRQRFEVEGADAAVRFLSSNDEGRGEAGELVSGTDAHTIWTAIALHTTPGVAERIDAFTRLIRFGVRLDFNLDLCVRYDLGSFRSEIEQHLPRLGIEKVLSNLVVKQAGQVVEEARRPENNIGGRRLVGWDIDSEKHPKASWPGMLLRAHLEDPFHTGVNPAF